MQNSRQSHITYSSPKRKRSDYSLNAFSPPSRLKTTNLPDRPVGDSQLIQEGSPCAVVAGHFRQLDLGETNPISKLNFGKALDSSMVHKNKQLSIGFKPDPPALRSQSDKCSADEAGRDQYPTARLTDQDSQIPASRLEIPETPRLKPTLSPSPVPPHVGSPYAISPALWWKDAEITGHDPKDPADDGYGINGVGFLPTPAVAHARAERRKRQVVEWKNREAREARQKRSEMRRRRDMEIENSGPGTGGLRGEETRKVRFLET